MGLPPKGTWISRKYTKPILKLERIHKYTSDKVVNPDI
jgi:hypothetical protein